MIANRIQEEAFGTLDRATLKLLDGLARREGAHRCERNLKIGTVLERDYQGRRHTVTVGPDGFLWEGTSYSRQQHDRPHASGRQRGGGPRHYCRERPAEQCEPQRHCHLDRR
jgi:hypothetical protein